jgi:selenide,water dikinase
VLLLTKPLGTGVVGTAIKSGRAPAEVVETASRWMATLNKAAAEAVATAVGVHACTDITGFGLIGHAMEIAAASRVSVEIRAASVPLIDGVLPLVASHRSGGMSTNRQHFGGRVLLHTDLPRDLEDLLYDPQTSGGLLLSVAAEHQTAMDAALAARNVPFWHIGRVIDQDAAAILVV